MTRTGERTTVTSEAVPGVALTLSVGRGYHGTADDLDRAAQFSPAQFAVRVAGVDENRNLPVTANVGPALAPDHGIQP